VVSCSLWPASGHPARHDRGSRRRGTDLPMDGVTAGREVRSGGRRRSCRRRAPACPQQVGVPNASAPVSRPSAVTQLDCAARLSMARPYRRPSSRSAAQRPARPRRHSLGVPRSAPARGGRRPRRPHPRSRQRRPRDTAGGGSSMRTPLIRRVSMIMPSALCAHPAMLCPPYLNLRDFQPVLVTA